MKGRYARPLAMALAAVMALLASLPAYAVNYSSRDETVYVDMTSDGAVKGIVASVYLANAAKRDELTDAASLTDIKEITDNDSPKLGTSGEVTFKAEGEDVAYQGKAALPLPLTVSVSYSLNGRTLPAADIAGKSGHIKITLRIKNNMPAQREVDGELVDLYTPFTVIATYTLGDRFSNITTNCRLTSQAGSSTVTGTLLPGLKESLDEVDSDKVRDTLTIEADVKEFELDEAMLIAVTGLIEADDLTDIDDIQKLIDGLDDISDATRELAKGARTLKEGTEEYADGSAEFARGMGELVSGAREAYSGAKEAADKIAQAKSGMSGGSSSGLSSLPSADAAAAAVEGMLGTSTDAAIVAAVKGYVSGVVGGYASATSSMSSALSDVSSQMGAFESGMNELAGGLKELADGTGDVQDAAWELYDGAMEIDGGIGELYTGLRKLSRSGLKKMMDELSPVEVSLARKDALIALADEYSSYSGIGVQEKGSAQFVYTIAEIRYEQPIQPATDTTASETNAASAPATKTSLWERIRFWFEKTFE